MIRRIVTVEEANPVLRSVARPVQRVDATVRRLMDDMVETMRHAPGVGLAAPQIGVPRRVIVVEVPLTEPGEDGQSDPEPSGADSSSPSGDRATRLWTLANPEIIWASEETQEDQEACLSVPELYGDVPRAVAIRVRALDRSGRPVTFDAQGFEARVLQHEIDHLDGILFVDRVTSLDKLYRVEERPGGEYVRVPISLPQIG